MRIPLLSLVAISAFAQVPASSPLAGPVGRTARIEGVVVADANGLPLRRATVTLTPLEAERPPIGTQTDDRGTFLLRDIEPGTYQLTAQRDGYLTTPTFRRSGSRMPPRFYIGPRETMSSVEFRLRPWAVIAGKVRFEDGDPAVNLRVDLYRQYHLRGRRGFTRVTSATTNDRGEYRVHGLPPAAYFVAVEYEGTRLGDGVDVQARLDSAGRELPIPSYTTTFYPGTLKLSEATPVRLREGDDLTGIDVYLRPIERVNLSGRITHGVTGEILKGATIALERLDAGETGTLPVRVQSRFDEDGRFHVDKVAPGLYQMWVESAGMLGRQTIQVTNFAIDDLEISVLPNREWSGKVTLAPDAMALPRGYQPYVVLEPRSERGAVFAPKVTNNQFDVTLQPQEVYDVFIDNLPPDHYISEIRAAGTDVRASGLSTAMVSNQPFEIILDTRGGQVIGLVTAATSSSGLSDPIWPGATVALIPDPPRQRLQHYRQTFADEFGRFTITGVVPGRYTLTAWLDEAPCDIYDEEALDFCRATGTTITVPERGQVEVPLRIRALPTR